MSAATVTELRQVRELLATPERWAHDDDAYSADGSPCDPCSPEAVAWNIGGAIRRVVGDNCSMVPAIAALQAVAPIIGSVSCVETSLEAHSDLLNWIDQAVEHEHAASQLQGSAAGEQSSAFSQPRTVRPHAT